jgi:hypothetical protein
VLKAQDILVCVYLAVSSRGQTYPQIADALKIGISTAHGAAQRAQAAKLLDDNNHPVRPNLLEFLCHGLRYVFYPERGSIIRGVPTGAAAPGLREHLASTPENSPVWPAASGRARGYSLTPLYPTIPEIAPANATLHAALAAIDLLRIGTARERAFAGEFIEKLMTQQQQ